MSKAKKNSETRYLGNCPICSNKFSLSMASKLGGTWRMNTMYVECVKCGSSVILGVARHVPGIITTVGMLTDMKRLDVERLSAMPAITLDEVLEMHRSLENDE